MKFDTKIKRKLFNILKDKCIELQCEDTSNKITSIWIHYLMELNLQRVHKIKRIKGFVHVEDPLYYGNYIKIKKDLAEKIIVLGLP
jgi:hypothetical protein